MPMLKNLIWFVFAFFAIGVGLYPYLYLVVDMSQGLLGSKTEALLSNSIWNFFFYTHILLGGVTLLSGWSQFIKKLRNNRINLHRHLGKIYVVAVLLSGIAGLYISFFATGGLVSQLGFGALAVLWLGTTFMAYISIRNKKIILHQQWMIRSYALAFAAVTLRLWLPSLTGFLNMEFVDAYRIIAWMCWVPNLIFAEFLVRQISGKRKLSPI